MIDFYGHFGDINIAKSIYDCIVMKKTSINNMYYDESIYQNKQYRNFLRLYDDVIISKDQLTQTQINDYVHMLAIEICGILKDIEKGSKIHKSLKLRSNKKVKLRNALIEFYFKCGDVHNAELIFNEMKKKPTRSINAMIRRYIDIGKNQKALQLYDIIDDKDKDQVSYLFAIKACINSGNIIKGKQSTKVSKIVILSEWNSNSKRID